MDDRVPILGLWKFFWLKRVFRHCTKDRHWNFCTKAFSLLTPALVLHEYFQCEVSLDVGPKDSVRRILNHFSVKITQLSWHIARLDCHWDRQLQSNVTLGASFACTTINCGLIIRLMYIPGVNASQKAFDVYFSL